MYFEQQTTMVAIRGISDWTHLMKRMFPQQASRRTEIAMEIIDYGYINKRFIVTCSRCDYTVSNVQSEKEAQEWAGAHARYMNNDCNFNGHYCNVEQIVR